MRVLHLPLEVAGQVGEMCRELRRQGCHAVGYNWRHNYLQYDHKLLHSDAYEMINTLDTALNYFDIFHYHTGYTLFKDKSDIRIAAEAGKAVVMHHRGNDVRIASKAVRGKHGYNPYVYTGDSQPEEQIIRNLQYFAKYVSAVLVQDYELYDYVIDYYDEVHILPRLYDISKLTPPKQAGKERPLVVHAPTSRSFKGTDQIERIAAKLQQELNFDFVIIEKKAMAEAKAIMQAADIVIDQILCGMYGNVSIEAMAMGKPVICYIRPDIAARLPKGLPIISANPDTLYDELKHLLLQPELRLELGRYGNQYVREHHDSTKIIKQLIEIYQKISPKIVR